MKSFPFIKQKDTMLCGVAALTMVWRPIGMGYNPVSYTHLTLPTNSHV